MHRIVWVNSYIILVIIMHRNILLVLADMSHSLLYIPDPCINSRAHLRTIQVYILASAVQNGELEKILRQVSWRIKENWWMCQFLRWVSWETKDFKLVDVTNSQFGFIDSKRLENGGCVKFSACFRKKQKIRNWWMYQFLS